MVFRINQGKAVGQCCVSAVSLIRCVCACFPHCSLDAKVHLGFSFIGVRALSGQLKPLYSGMFYFGFHY